MTAVALDARSCGGKGEPVLGCWCSFCRRVRPTLAPVEKERLSFPTGDLTEDLETTDRSPA